jgi:hypothetical protein
VLDAGERLENRAISLCGTFGNAWSYLADAPHPRKVAAVDLRELKALELAARARIVFQDG